MAGGGAKVRVKNPGSQTGFVGLKLSPLTVTATDSAGLTLTFSATGLPPGVKISASGVISGTPTKAGTYTVRVIATDSGGSHGSARFTFTVEA